MTVALLPGDALQVENESMVLCTLNAQHHAALAPIGQSCTHSTRDQGDGNYSNWIGMKRSTLDKQQKRTVDDDEWSDQ